MYQNIWVFALGTVLMWPITSLTSAGVEQQGRSTTVVDYSCPGGCKCATLDEFTLDKVQVHCEIVNIHQNLINFTVIPTDHTALLYLICNNVFESVFFDGMVSHLTQLEQFFLQDCKIFQLFAGALRGLEALRILNIRVDQIARTNLTIDAGAFDHTPNIEEVYVFGMGITKLPEDLFCGLNNLSRLNLSDNFLSEERNLGFMSKKDNNKTCLPALTLLDLRGNQLEALTEPLAQYMSNVVAIFLQRNNLQRIGAETFVNLNNLGVLQLSHNKLTSIEHNLFTGLSNLAFLFMDHNEITSLPDGIFQDTVNLLQLDLTHNSLPNECLSAIKHLSWLQKLDIGQNHLSYIETKTFSGLHQLTEINIEENEITQLEKCSLCTNLNLQMLKLGNNYLQMFDLDEIFGPNGADYLKILNLTKNQISTEHLKLNFSNMAGMEQLILDGNDLTEIPTHAAELEKLTWLYVQNNNIQDITESTFESFPNLQYLALRDNLITYIPKRVFRAMPHLILIDMSRNAIETLEYECFNELPVLAAINLKHNNIQDISGVFYALPSLQVLILDYNAVSQITSEYMPSTLVELRLSHNDISSTLGLHLTSMPNLKLVDLTFNKLTRIYRQSLRSTRNPTVYLGGNYLFCNCEMEFLQTINDSPTLYAKIGDLHNLLCYTSHKQFKFLNKLQPNDFLCEYSEVCGEDCNCCFNTLTCSCYDTCPAVCQCFRNSDSNFNRIECSGTNISSIPLRIPTKANQIFLDGNNFSEIHDKPFMLNSKTEHLYLNGSGIVNIEAGTFQGLQQLTVLYLDNNDITMLKNNTFQGLPMLEELYINHNAVEYIHPQAFDGLPNLKILHLEGNKLRQMNHTVFDKVLPSLEEIYLSNNEWECDCTSGPEFQDWLISIFDKLKDKPACDTLEPGLKGNSSKNFFIEVDFSACFNNTRSLYIDRPSKALVPVISVMLSVFTLTLVTIFLLYRYRHIIQVWLYSRYGVRLSKTKEDQDKDYDAFISYSSKDESFVVSELACRLEEGDPPYRLCVHYRDWIVGRGIAESVISSVHSSRRTIMLLSKNYIDSEWCNYEFQTAHHRVMKDKTCRLIVILMDDEPPEGLDDELKLYIKTHTYIKRSDPWFWERLKYALPSVRQEEKIERWAGKAREKEMLEKTKQALAEIRIQGGGVCGEGVIGRV